MGRLRTFLRNERGGLAAFAAVAVPAVAVLGVGATELVTLANQRSRMQDAADAVALSAAQELAFAPDRDVVARAEARLLVLAAEINGGGTNTPSVTVEYDKGRAVGVTVA